MAYTADSLSEYMATELGATGVSLGIVDGGDALTEAVNEVVLLLGALAAQTDDLKVRVVARWQAWLVALNVATGQYDIKAGSATLAQSQVFDQIMRRLAMAEAAASRYSEVAAALGGGSVAYVTSSSVASSPYGWPRDEWS